MWLQRCRSSHTAAVKTALVSSPQSAIWVGLVRGCPYRRRPRSFLNLTLLIPALSRQLKNPHIPKRHIALLIVVVGPSDATASLATSVVSEPYNLLLYLLIALLEFYQVDGRYGCFVLHGVDDERGLLCIGVIAKPTTHRR